MNDNKGLIGSTLGKVGDLTQQLGKTVSDEVKKTGQATAAQIGLENKVEKVEGQSPEKSSSSENAKTSGASEKEQEDYVKALYGIGSGKDEKDAQKQTQTKEENPDKTGQQHLQQHDTTYYQPTFEQPPQQGESVSEKLEREDQQEKMQDLELQKKKPHGAPKPGQNPFETSPESKQGAKIMG